MIVHRLVIYMYPCPSSIKHKEIASKICENYLDMVGFRFGSPKTPDDLSYLGNNGLTALTSMINLSLANFIIPGIEKIGNIISIFTLSHCCVQSPNS